MSFEAKFHGECAAGDHIRPGDMCRYEDDEIVHENCVAPTQPDNRHMMCPKCWMIHKGECL